MTYFPRAALMIGTPGILLYSSQNATLIEWPGESIPNPPFEIAVIRRYNVNAMLHDTVD